MRRRRRDMWRTVRIMMVMIMVKTMIILVEVLYTVSEILLLHPLEQVVRLFINTYSNVTENTIIGVKVPVIDKLSHRLVTVFFSDL